ncbi:hypothetical protein HY622_04145 [Candidatus Uhrbacteria bacterium]|nr:hypothetical protein [Candidatus Uhrbacteria bacterium]
MVVAITWFAGANMASLKGEREPIWNGKVVLELELDAVIKPAKPKVSPSHQVPQPPPLKQPIDEELAKRVAALQTR